MGIFDNFFKRSSKDAKEVKIGLSGMENLEKSVQPTPNLSFLDGKVEQSKAVFSLDSKQPYVDNIHIKKGRMSDKELRELAQYDSIISLIVQTRSNQLMSFGRKSRSKYDRGFILRENIAISEDPRVPDEKKKLEVKNRTELANAICSYVESCGTKNKFVIDYVFKESDTTFKHCSLADFLSAQARNLLVFGRCATNIIRNAEGVPVMFRPLPVENIFRVIDQEDISISEHDDDVHPESVQDYAEYKAIPEGRRPHAYVLRIDGKNQAFFTDEEVVVTYLQKQAYENLDGYPLSIIEQAYYTVGLHFSAQQYMSNSLTRGLASKGIINMKTVEGGIVSPEQVEHFRKLFSNYVARNDNSATIPVISGPIDVEFIELNATSKDLEFLNLYSRVIQVLCGSFQIDPREIGFSSVDGTKASLGGDSKQDEIVQGEERGLRQLVETLFDLLNNIVYEVFPEAVDTLKFEAIGLGQNTKETDLKLYKEELQTSGTFGKIWSDSERLEAFPFGGNIPTSPVFHESVARYMKYSEFRYHFMGEKGALENPDYDFIIDPGLNKAYQESRNKIQENMGAQAEIQTEQMLLELEGGAQQIQAQQQQVEQQSQAHQQQMQMNEQNMQQQEMQKQLDQSALDKEAKQGAAEFLEEIIGEREEPLSVREMYEKQ